MPQFTNFLFPYLALFPPMVLVVLVSAQRGLFSNTSMLQDCWRRTNYQLQGSLHRLQVAQKKPMTSKISS